MKISVDGKTAAFNGVSTNINSLKLKNSTPHLTSSSSSSSQPIKQHQANISELATLSAKSR